MSHLVPDQLPFGTTSLPPLGGRLFAVYRASWWLLFALAITAAGQSWFDLSSSVAILALRLAKSFVLIAVSAILFRRRAKDPVAAMLSLAFLLWTASSSIDIGSSAVLPAVLDRFRFLLFAMALLLFPDGRWRPKWTPFVALGIAAAFLLGLVEATGVLATKLYLPIAIACVVAALVALVAKYGALDEGTEKQQVKWVMLGLIAGISFILAARAAAAATAGISMPVVGSVAIEGLFQSGIIVLALGFLVSLLRFRLYDAEAAISRSAIYATLTLSVVGIFAAGESLIELIGQHYFGSNVGSVSGAVAAALAAILLTPLHRRISHWAEQHFQHDLAVLKQELPDRLITLSAGASVKRLAATVLPRIEQAVQATRLALLVDDRLVATQGINKAATQKLLTGWRPSPTEAPLSRDDESAFPLQIALRCPLGRIRGWLLLGPRPDGSSYGIDDVAALTAIVPALQRALVLVAEREAEQTRQNRAFARMNRSIAALSSRLDQLQQL